MSWWRESFKGKSLDRKWTVARVSTGGQNDGQWMLEVRDGKLYGVGISGGTETGYWGPKISRPVNIPGDFIFEYILRQRFNAGVVAARLGLDLTDPTVLCGLRNAELWGGGATNSWSARDSGGNPMPFPGCPAKNSMSGSSDNLIKARTVRQNGVLSHFIDGILMGQENGITTTYTRLYIYMGWWQAGPQVEKWIHEVSVWPKEAVL